MLSAVTATSSTTVANPSVLLLVSIHADTSTLTVLEVRFCTVMPTGMSFS